MRFIALFLLLSIGPAQAQTFEQVFTTPDWLSNNLTDDKIVILQVGSADGYIQGHIPGAVYMGNRSFITTSHDSLYVQLPTVESFQNELSSRGINAESTIIICSDWEYFAWAYRLYVTFKYFGLEHQVRILNGGIKGWDSKSLPVSTDTVVAKPAAGNLPLKPRPEILTDKDWIKDNHANSKVCLVDARRDGYYSGESAGSYTRSGHISGARNITWTTLVDENHFLISHEMLADIYKHAGLSPEKTLISYCHVGLRASVIYTIGQSLGYEARLYDGSYNEWDRLSADYPVVTGH